MTASEPQADAVSGLLAQLDEAAYELGVTVQERDEARQAHADALALNERVAHESALAILWVRAERENDKRHTNSLMDEYLRTATERDTLRSLLDTWRAAPRRSINAADHALIQALGGQLKSRQTAQDRPDVPEPGSWHVGVSWDDTAVEDECPCPQEPCGLVDPERANAECGEHPLWRARRMRQAHRATDCPGQREAVIARHLGVEVDGGLVDYLREKIAVVEPMSDEHLVQHIYETFARRRRDTRQSCRWVMSGTTFEQVHEAAAAQVRRPRRPPRDPDPAIARFLGLPVRIDDTAGKPYLETI